MDNRVRNYLILRVKSASVTVAVHVEVVSVQELFKQRVNNQESPKTASLHNLIDLITCNIKDHC